MSSLTLITLSLSLSVDFFVQGILVYPIAADSCELSKQRGIASEC